MQGLTSAEARRLAQRFGPNEIHPHVERSAWRELAKRFRNPLIAILLAASAISAFTGDLASFAIIVTMIVLSVVIDFVQEHRAARAAEALRRRVQVHATVIRDGRETRVPVRRIVPDDVVKLSAGSIIPADGELLEANHLHVNEALLTGEPFPVEKQAAAQVFMGTSVVSGTGTMHAAAIGAATRIGIIARELATEPPPSTVERGTRAFGMLIMRLTAFMVLFVLLVNTILGRPLLESFLFALALAVGLTPELLPMIVSVTLAHGAVRLAREHVIVKRLAAIESLGSMDVLCTDKTGTLTEARIHIEGCLDREGRESAHVRELARLNSHHQAGIASPLDAAIDAGGKVVDPRWRKLGEIPFDFERRRVSVLLTDGERSLVIAKGAPEDLLRHCALDDAARASAQRRLDDWGREGLRVLAVATKDSGTLDEEALDLAGFVTFVDPPKRGARKAIAQLASAGVSVKILTGDGEAVTRHLCGQLGIDIGGVLTGADIARLDDTALAARAQDTTLFCRVDPMQKNRIVAMLRARGHVVGFMGDGVNDAPALHSADVSLSVENAVDVAKEAADLILLRQGLDVVHRGVIEGRRTFVNIRKYILMGTSSNFGNMFSMAGAALFLPFLPLLPTQILLNNLLYDISEIPIPVDDADAEEVATPQHWDMSLIRDFMWVLGPVSSLFDFLTFYVLLAFLHADETLFRTGWFIESLATQVLVIFVIRTRGRAFASHPSPVLAATSLSIVAVALALPWMPFAQALGFAPPPASFYGVLGAMVIAYLVLAEMSKRMFYRRRQGAR